MDTIVVPLDGSELAERAIPWAALLARARGASLTLARVVVSGRSSVELNEHVREEHLSATWVEAAAYLSHVKQRLQTEGLEVLTTVREGVASLNIVDVVADTNASAIVMSTHGRGGLTRLVLGSVADEVLHESPAPVLLIPPDADNPEPRLDKILVPLDGSALAERAIPLARKLGTPDAKIVLLQVVEPVEGFVNAGALTELRLDELATQREERDADAYLVQLGEQLRSEGVNVGRSVLRGRPAARIEEAARIASPDVVVMSSHGHSGVRRLRLGSIADEVVRRISVPVLVLTSRMLTTLSPGKAPVGSLVTGQFVAFRSDDLLADAVRRMANARVVIAPVLDHEGAALGILTARGLLKWRTRTAGAEGDLGHKETTGGQETVAELLDREALTIDASAEMSVAAETLLEHHADGLVVVREGRPVGVVTLGDLLEWVPRAAKPNGTPMPES